jgi:hypothetical protein
LVPILKARKERVDAGLEVLPPPDPEMIARQEYVAACIRELLERLRPMPPGQED